MPECRWRNARLIAAILLGCVGGSVNAETCTGARDLIEMPQAELSDAQPCSPIGWLYMHGASDALLLVPPVRIDLPEELTYYALTRNFLILSKGTAPEEQTFPEFEEAFASLIVARHLVEADTKMDAERKMAYLAYPTFAYLRFSNLGRTSQDNLIAALRDTLEDSRFSDAHRLRCFIRHDIPILGVDDILTSAAFQACMSSE